MLPTGKYRAAKKCINKCCFSIDGKSCTACKRSIKEIKDAGRRAGDKYNHELDVQRKRIRPDI